MVEIFKTKDTNGLLELERVPNIIDGTWINMVAPSEREIDQVASKLKIPVDFFKAALDDDERARIESDDGYTLIIIDIPVINVKEHAGNYITMPLGIIIGSDNILTICLQETMIVSDFCNAKVKTFFTFKKTRFLFQILHKNATYYLQYLRHIDRESTKIENELHNSMKNKQLIQLLSFEKSLVYFSTSLKSNENILERLLRSKPIKTYPDDEELLEDVIIENKQAIEMATIYSTILNSMMDSFASVISNNVNSSMKFLTSFTIVLSIPTMIGSFFGMNVKVPMQGFNGAFLVIFLLSLVISSILGLVMLKKNLF